jgi:hypothetical protein
MHMRGEIPAGEYRLSAVLFYLLNPEDQEASAEDSQRMVVDEKSVKFVIQRSEE